MVSENKNSLSPNVNLLSSDILPVQPVTSAPGLFSELLHISPYKAFPLLAGAPQFIHTPVTHADSASVNCEAIRKKLVSVVAVSSGSIIRVSVEELHDEQVGAPATPPP